MNQFRKNEEKLIQIHKQFLREISRLQMKQNKVLEKYSTALRDKKIEKIRKSLMND